MTLPIELANYLPDDTARTWQAIAPLVPKVAYLAGGTAITAHIRHRVSQDLDFFLEDQVDLADLVSTLAAAGPFAVTLRNENTLNGVFSATKVQFLDASAHHFVDKFTEIGGLRIASMRDLVAMKLKVIGDRGELRDYFDLMAIEQHHAGSVEEGLGDYLRRYAPAHGATALHHLVLALGYLEDVDEDDLVPTEKSKITEYWHRRQPIIARAAGLLS